MSADSPAVESPETPWTLPPADPALEALLGAPLPPETATGPGVGDIVQARVERVVGDALELRIGDATFVKVPTSEASVPGTRELPEIGAVVDVALEVAHADGSFEGSIGRAALLRVWDDVHAAVAEHRKVQVTVQHLVRGGFAVDVMGLRGLLPGAESGIPVSDAEIAIGRTLDAVVLRLDERDFRPVVTRKAFAEDELRAAREAAFADFAPGQVVEGIVSSIRPFGAFVRLGSVEGLLHISEITLENLDDPAAAVKVGDPLQVKIVDVDARRGRISLSRRDLLLAEAEQQMEAIEPGSVVTGTVRRLTEFGAFIELRPGIEGLCHVSELSWTGRVTSPADVLTVGQSVQVRVLSRDSRRIALSLRAVEANPWDDFANSVSANDIVTGTIRRIESYGLFIEVAPGIEGLAHISDLAWEGRPAHPSEVAPYAVGGEIQVRILRIERDKRRVALGVKQLTPDPWDAAGDRVVEGTLFETRITRTEDAAAWAEVVPGLEGRIHISEISLERVDSIRAAVRVGQEVQVVVKRADREKRRVDLSMKEVEVRIAAETPSSYTDSTADEPSALAQALASKGLLKG